MTNERSEHPFHTQQRTKTRDKRPKSPCPICYSPGVTTSESDMLEWACHRGHAWLGTRADAERCSTFEARLYLGNVT